MKRINDDLGISLSISPCFRGRRADVVGLHAEIARLYTQKQNKLVSHFGEKSVVHTACVARILDVSIFPSAKILFIFRDGRDVSLSLTRVPWASGDLYINFALWLYCYRSQKRVPHALVNARVLFVRYEQLVTEPSKQFARILDFLGLRFERKVIDGEGAPTGIPPWEYPWKSRASQRITEDRLGLWRDDVPTEQLEKLETWGQWALRDLGYQLVTNPTCPPGWMFLAAVGWRALLWHLRRPRFGQLPGRMRDKERAQVSSFDKRRSVVSPLSTEASSSLSGAD